jgi:ABC-type taurine transport system ATPase subunit
MLTLPDSWGLILVRPQLSSWQNMDKSISVRLQLSGLQMRTRSTAVHCMLLQIFPHLMM